MVCQDFTTQSEKTKIWTTQIDEVCSSISAQTIVQSTEHSKIRQLHLIPFVILYTSDMYIDCNANKLVVTLLHYRTNL
jgi:hypothetical protein